MVIPKPFQIKTQERTAAGRNLILSAEPGAGKTLAALMAIEATLGQGRTIVLVNAITLLMQHLKTFTNYFEEKGLAVTIASIWSNISEGERLAGLVRAQIVIFTAEAFLVEAAKGNIPFNEFSLAVLDEVQLADDRTMHSYTQACQLLKKYPYITKLGLTGSILSAGPIMRALGASTMIEVKPDPARSESRYIETIEVFHDPVTFLIANEIRARKQLIWLMINDRMKTQLNLTATAGGQQQMLLCLERLEGVSATLSNERQTNQNLWSVICDTRRKLHAIRFLAELEYLAVSENLVEANRRLSEQVHQDHEIESKRAAGLMLMPLIRYVKHELDLVTEIDGLVAEGYCHPKDEATMEILREAVNRRWHCLVFCSRRALVEYLANCCEMERLPAMALSSRSSDLAKQQALAFLQPEQAGIIVSTSALLYGIDLSFRMVVLRSHPPYPDMTNQLYGRVCHTAIEPGAVINLVLDDPLDQRLYFASIPPQLRRRRRTETKSPAQLPLVFV